MRKYMFILSVIIISLLAVSAVSASDSDNFTTGAISSISNSNIDDQMVVDDTNNLGNESLVNDVENIFDDVCFIGKGKIILNGCAEDLRLEKGVSIDKLYIQTFMDE
jgi:hypothetical protein